MSTEGPNAPIDRCRAVGPAAPDHRGHCARRGAKWISLAICVLPSLWGCDRSWLTAARTGQSSGQPTASAAPAKGSQSPPTVRIAALQYAGQDASAIHPRCDEDDALCAIAALTRRAARGGAKLVVTPEYALGLDEPAAEPELGWRPSNESDRPTDGPVVVLSELARELEIYLVAAMRTSLVEADGGQATFNSQIAFDPDGGVIAKHHKFVLYAGESAELTAGADVTAFDTPFGRVGMLICADIYGDPDLHDRLTSELGASIIALSTQWTVDQAIRWQAGFALDWGVVVAGANSSAGTGSGGGIFGPDGSALAKHEGDRPAVTMATVTVQ